MEDWKKRLYDTYVTSGQAGSASAGWDFHDRSRFPFLRKLVRDHVPSSPDLEILDLACGHGTLLHTLKKSGYRNLCGVDVSPEQVELGHRLGVPEIRCESILAFLENTDRTFDLVFMLDILEHMTPPELFRVLDGVHGALKPGGRLILTVPNGAGVFGMRVRYSDLTHETCYTPKSMEQALTTTGFGTVRASEIRPVVHGLKSAVRAFLWRLLSLPHRLLLVAETGMVGHILTRNMVVTARRREAGPAVAVPGPER